MKKEAIGILAIFLLLTASVPAVAAPATAPHPRAVVTDAIKPFKSVIEGEDVVKEFAIRNEGDAPLVIERVGTG